MSVDPQGISMHVSNMHGRQVTGTVPSVTGL